MQFLLIQLEIYDPAARRPLIFKLQEILLYEMSEAPVYYEHAGLGIYPSQAHLGEGVTILNFYLKASRIVPLYFRITFHQINYGPFH
jgi:hypothetical protein